MKLPFALAIASTVMLFPALCHAQDAGSTTSVSVTVDEMKDVLTGWSAKKTILGQDVYNDKDEKIGSVDDIIIAPDKAVSYVIIGTGGFLGVDKHDVAIPVIKLKLNDKKVVLPGASKEALEASPAFEYAKQ